MQEALTATSVWVLLWLLISRVLNSQQTRFFAAARLLGLDSPLDGRDNHLKTRVVSQRVKVFIFGNQIDQLWIKSE